MVGSSSFDIVLDLLRTALGGGELPGRVSEIEPGQWREVYREASFQGVGAIVADAFRIGSAPPKELLGQWLSDVVRTESRNRHVAGVAAAQRKLWEDSGICAAMLKGGAVARLYPVPEHRHPGDIDWYFPGRENWDRARALVQKEYAIGYDSDGDFHYLRDGVQVEHHRSWLHLDTLKARRTPASIVDGKLAPEDDLLMISTHILHHAMVSGVGLRHLADAAVAFVHYDGRYDRSAYVSRLSDLGLSGWDALLSAVLCREFAVPEDILPSAPDFRYEERFMSLVRSDGDVGASGKRLFSNFRMRFSIFPAICPALFLGRYRSLARGRVRRVLGIVPK